MQITIEDFKKTEIKTGKIIEVKPHPDADKLYILQVNLGNETRQIVTGLKDHYTEKELLNKQIAVITNLKPANIRGIESNGMLLAAVNNNKVSLLTTDKEIEEGSNIE